MGPPTPLDPEPSCRAARPLVVHPSIQPWDSLIAKLDKVPAGGILASGHGYHRRWFGPGSLITARRASFRLSVLSRRARACSTPHAGLHVSLYCRCRACIGVTGNGLKGLGVVVWHSLPTLCPPISPLLLSFSTPCPCEDACQFLRPLGTGKNVCHRQIRVGKEGLRG